MYNDTSELVDYSQGRLKQDRESGGAATTTTTAAAAEINGNDEANVAAIAKDEDNIDDNINDNINDATKETGKASEEIADVQ